MNRDPLQNNTLSIFVAYRSAPENNYDFKKYLIMQFTEAKFDRKWIDC